MEIHHILLKGRIFLQLWLNMIGLIKMYGYTEQAWAKYSSVFCLRSPPPPRGHICLIYMLSTYTIYYCSMRLHLSMRLNIRVILLMILRFSPIYLFSKYIMVLVSLHTWLQVHIMVILQQGACSSIFW